MHDCPCSQMKVPSQEGTSFATLRYQLVPFSFLSLFFSPSLSLSCQQSQVRETMNKVIEYTFTCLLLLPFSCYISNCQSVLSPSDHGMSLWIDENQVKQYSGFQMSIPVIVDSIVLPYILDPNFEKYLPIIPPQLNSFNFTWKGGVSGSSSTFYYLFDELRSYNKSILGDPVISIDSKGSVPKKASVFSVKLPCENEASGVASFTFGLLIFNDHGSLLKGMPLRLRLNKQCSYRVPDEECDRNCANGGWCNRDKICECPVGYVGKHCTSALCYPACMNNGSCTAPGICTCTEGYQGPHCEGGICREKCLNGGKCVQKDTCTCTRGYFGSRCQYSKCLENPCYNRGRCVGINKCRCRNNFSGPQCQTPPFVEEDRFIATDRSFRNDQGIIITSNPGSINTGIGSYNQGTSRESGLISDGAIIHSESSSDEGSDQIRSDEGGGRNRRKRKKKKKKFV